MTDRGYQERAKQYTRGDSDTSKQQPVYNRQQPAKQPQPMYQTNQQGSNAGNTGTGVYTTQGRAPQQYQQQLPVNQPLSMYQRNQAGDTGTPVYVVQGRAPQQYQQQQQHDSNFNNDPRNPPPDDSTTEWASPAFADKRIRHAFIRKVYLILTAMLLVTVVCICIFLFVKPVKVWVQEHYWVMWISIGVYFVIAMVLTCCQSVRRSFPANYICLIIFNLAFSYVCAAMSSYYSTEFVLIAAGITAVVCLSISIFAIQTKIDFTLCNGLIFVLSMVLMLFGIVVMFVFMFGKGSYILVCVYGAVAALVFSLFLAYDTQTIIGGRKHQLSPEEYIYGALTLYLDVGTMFMIILSFFSSSN